MHRSHNFFAGPAILPVSAIEAATQAVAEFAGMGMSILEISHRDKAFDAIIKKASSDALKIMNLSEEEYSVIFVGGGASTQFAMLPMNFLNKKADYTITGEWAGKAAKEAKLFGEVVEASSSKEANFNYIPKEYKVSEDADYFHYTSNNTIYGTEWKITPETGNVPLIADMSSDMFAMKRDWSKHSLIYAGAQKNIGPAGVVMVVVKKDFLAKAKENIPTMLKYKTHVDKESLYNTPPVFPIFVVGKTMEWILNEGGLEVIQEKNEKKAGLIYGMMDAYPEFYKGSVANKEDRSLMNLTWNLPTPELEEKFIKEAKALEMYGLKGHRSVGGVRASMYNACPLASAEALAKFMDDFRKKNI